jgi:nuclear pore complex protein Nup205
LIAEDEMAQSRLTSALRQQVLLLLVDTLEQPSPNFAHFLLGFDVRKSVDKTVLQNPGILGTPRSCLHSLLLIVSRGVMTAVGAVSQQQEAQLAATSAMPSSMELAYRLIYALCANRDTSVATMRYLRTTDDFFHKHLQCLPYGLAAAKGHGQCLIGDPIRIVMALFFNFCVSFVDAF